MTANASTGSRSVAAGWSHDATEWQKRIPFDDPHCWEDYLQRAVEDGSCELCELRSNGERIGIFVYRVERLKDPELVVVAVYATGNHGVDLLEYFDEFATAIAKRKGCASIRCHTLRPGLVKKVHALGYRTSEIVLRKVL